MSEKITIGILNGGGREYLEKILPPILNQDYENFDVLILDNGSTDGSIAFFESLKNEKIKIIKNDRNLGYNVGKNQIVNNSTGEYVLLLDNDILIDNKNYLSEILNFYKELNDVAFLSPLMRDDGSDITKYYGIYFYTFGKRLIKKINFEKITKYKDKIIIGAFHGGSVFFKKDVWDKIGGYQETQMFSLNDFDLGMRAYLFGYKNYLYNKDCLIHLGKAKDENKKHFAWKFQLTYSGFATSMIKNYSLKNILWAFPVFFVYSAILNLALIITKKNLHLIKSWFLSWVYFIKTLKNTLNERKKIQSKRAILNDIFLKVKPINFK